MMKNKRTYMSIALVVLIGVFLLSIALERQIFRTTRPSFVGESHRLKATTIVPTLDAPIPDGMNTVWSAAFLCAWKALQQDLAKEPISLDGAPETVNLLNNASDPRPHIPENALYATAGWTQKGIIAQIWSDLKQKFPAKSPPTFPGIVPNAYVAYAYLEANVRFRIPYFQNPRPLTFTDGSGKATELRSFGICPSDGLHPELRRQPAILFRKRGSRPEHFGMIELIECVVDLDRTSTPSQAVIALTDRKRTLTETYESVETQIAMAGKSPRGDDLGPVDTLTVPDVFCRITHYFKELEGHSFVNAALRGQRLDVAQQDILFRLDRSGAQLESEAEIYPAAIPAAYVFDRPFLLYMKQRGAKSPYFVVWIDNAELLRKW